MSAALTISTPEVPARRVTGGALPWMRDLGLVGFATGFGAPAGAFASLIWIGPAMLAVEQAVFCLVAGVFGAMSGAALGALAPWVLDRVRRRVPLPVLALLALPAGALWGGLVGGSTGTAWAVLIDPGWVSLSTLALPAAVLGGMVGAAVLGLFWFPYTFQTVLEGRRWPVVGATCAATPLLGAGMLWLFVAVLAML